MNIEALSEQIKILKEEIAATKNINGELKELCVQIQVLATEMKYMRETQDSHENRIKILEERPIKKMDTVTTTILTGVIGTILGVVLTMIGLK